MRAGRQIDWPLLAAIVGIPLLSLIVLLSASFDPTADQALRFSWGTPVVKQGIYLVGGLMLFFCIAFLLPSSLVQRGAWLWFIGACLLLVAVLAIGTARHGSLSWFDLGPIKFQPSELAKIAMIVLLARLMARRPPPPGGYSAWQLAPLVAVAGVPILLVIAQRDLGTALSMAGTVGCMVLFAGIERRTLIALTIVAVIGGAASWELLQEYQRQRIIAVFNPSIDPKGIGYHTIQSIIAVGSGSLFGKGYLQGTQTQLQFLPEHTTDFIFSVVAEEFGFVGSVFVIALYGFLLARLLRVAARSWDLWGAFVAVGVAGLFFTHTMINLGMVLGIAPVIGIPLPLFSYGGSALVSSLIALGIVFGVHRRRFGG